jgi:hypothetical protein
MVERQLPKLQTFPVGLAAAIDDAISPLAFQGLKIRLNLFHCCQ